MNDPIGPDAIRDFENSYGVRLPEDYKDFLIETNGGIPARSFFFIKGRPDNPEETIQDFLGIGVPKYPTSELSYPIALYWGAIPKELVPIANQDGGNYICLDLRAGKTEVVLWDKRHFWSTGEWREQDLYYIADSFDEFSASLMPNPY